MNTKEYDKHKKSNGDRMVTSGDNGAGEPMLVRQETHLPDELADRDNTTLADRTYQATNPWCGIIREDIIGTHKDTHAPGSHSRYQDNCSPVPVCIYEYKISYDTIEYKKYCQAKETMAEHSPECSEINVSASAEYTLKPASVKGDDNILTVEVLSSRVDNLKVPRFPGYNDEHRKPNGDGMVTSLRHETHIPCESTDILTDSTY